MRRILRQTHVVFSTCNNSGDALLKQNFAPTVLFIDEAGQPTVVGSSVPLIQLQPWDVCLIVGDTPQLRPFTLSGQFDEFLHMAQMSILALLERKVFEMIRLRQQYRMAPPIASFPARTFYNKALLNHPSVEKVNINATRFASALEKLYGLKSSHAIVDVKNSLSRPGTTSPSLVNPAIAYAVTDFMKQLLHNATRPTDIVVLTNYSAQRSLIESQIRRLVFENVIAPPATDEVKVLTVDAFSGLESSIVILDLVVAFRLHRTPRGQDVDDPHSDYGTSKSLTGYAKDTRRLNTALTRAQHGLAIFLQGTTATQPDRQAIGGKSGPAAVTRLLNDARSRKLVVTDNRIDSSAEGRA